ncbi:double-strand break repair helicase AddA [Siccirubricoccus sp. KC 17139]|uniref:DNA 3'-5' helicase n=1 Tax=Siccirubricoccus soli TaxID=2899147 RepID=A0ABT1DDY8_9PROT|nr:double-strand break repair helicase AddA [Siccirubricoccus soli]MCO6419470.1 double-strand break repair helicase AddA [Siccirubricoccus soli]MCP2685605.1 double-strand break repair helicase AddA [Siccirubricoccus soli]
MTFSARDRAQERQLQASDPLASAWVDASAGSGKTKVLIDRVLRLLLDPAQAPGRILCLTFTRAAAAEMQARLRKRLGAWTVAEEALLDAELERLIGTPPGEALRRRARSLLVEVLEMPGGMRISTIHAFCQSLLRGFPLEAGLPPQFSVLEEQDARALLAEAREAVLAGASGVARELALLAGIASADAFAEVSRALLEDRARERLEACLAVVNSIEGLRLRLATALGVPESLDEAEVLAAGCVLEEAPLRLAASLLGASKNENDRKRGARLAAWLDCHPEDRSARFAEWCEIFLTKEGATRAPSSLATKQVGARQAEVLAALTAEAERLLRIEERRAGCRLAAATAALLSLSVPILRRSQARQRSAGLLGYGDLIDHVRRILQDPGSAWVLFKLDGGLDHVLLDEAQDSNPAQWGIAAALTGEFFAGEGVERRQRSLSAAAVEAVPARRTIFAVGDIKQAIYGFQGADAEGFATWRRHYAARVMAGGGEFRPVQLDVSFRSTAPVLALVDAVFEDGPARDGVVPPGEVLRHLPDRLGHAGSVELWPLLRPMETPAPPSWVVPAEPEAAASAEALMAETLAERIARMIGTEMLPARGRPVRPGDVLVLLRRQANVALVPLLVRALKARQVAVAGVSRVKLIEHLAVMDLMALCDVLLLPEDDLQLAALLKSPLIGLSEEALLELAHGRRGSLWGALMQRRAAAAADRATQAAEWLARLADRADLVTPHALLAEVLGEASMDGTPARARILARLGPEAADVLDELLNAALNHEQRHPPSLQGFLHWLRQGGAEVKREAEGSGDAVRIMTVHNAKGLQAPIVILADVGAGQGNEAIRWLEKDGLPLPLWAPNKSFQAPAFLSARAADDRRRLEEENRLLYVALTRAEDRLICCGWGKDPKPWYRLVAAGFRRLPGAEEVAFDMAALGAPAAADFGDGMGFRYACGQEVAAVPDLLATEAAEAGALPSWATRPAPPEAAEAAIAPSALPGEEQTPAAPHGEADPGGRRFRRGRLVHALLQHLPEQEASMREAAARRFLARPGHGLSAEEQAETLAEVLTLLAEPAMQAAFAPGSLAEAPLAGRVGGRLIAGQVDRLVVAPDRVVVLDFKTNRPPPLRPEQVAPLYLRQMAAYRAVLREAFPGRRVECALVWTHGARLMPLPDDLLDEHAPDAAA